MIKTLQHKNVNTRINIKRALFILLCAFFPLSLAGCGQNTLKSHTPAEPTASAETAPQEQARQETESPARLYQNIYEQVMQSEASESNGDKNLAIVREITRKLGEHGITAIDSENQVDMVNASQMDALISALKNKGNTVLTVLIVSAFDRFTEYELHAKEGSLAVVKTYYQYEDGAFKNKSSVSYPADSWQYTDEGYFIFTGKSFTTESLVLTMSDEEEFAAWRVAPLDAQCREWNRQYVLPVGYGRNNMFLIDWNEENYGNLDFYDLFDKYYSAVTGQPVPYTASENAAVGAVYHIPEQEFEDAVFLHLAVDTETLRTKTKYLEDVKAYEYRPRGFYEVEYPNLPYPEVVSGTENADGTLTLLVNAVYPNAETSRAFTHELVVRPDEQGGFRYVANRVLRTERDYNTDWHTDRLTDEEWENVYGGSSLLTQEEKDALEANVLAAAANGIPGENPEQIEAFYADYQKNRDARVTVFHANPDGTIDALTFLHKDGKLQSCYIGIALSPDGIPQKTDESLREISEIKLTPKGYFIYAYKEPPQYAALCQYFRIRPLSEQCRELTEKYVRYLSYVNYNFLVTDWDESSAESVLTPGLYEDLCRIHTGKEPEMKDGRIPAAQYEEIMTRYLPVTKEQVRKLCDYDEAADSYPYEMTLHRQYPPFGEVVDSIHNPDGTITLTVDGVWIEEGTDCAFTNTLVIQPFEDGTFRYLSNSIEQKEAAIPSVDPSMR